MIQRIRERADRQRAIEALKRLTQKTEIISRRERERLEQILDKYEERYGVEI